MPKATRHLKHDIQEFSDWLRRMGRPRTAVEEARDAIRGAAVDAGDLGDDISHAANGLTSRFNHFVDDLTQDPEPDVVVARQAHQRAQELAKDVDDALAQANNDIPKAAKGVLSKLADSLRSAATKLSNFFKGFKKPTDPEPQLIHKAKPKEQGRSKPSQRPEYQEVVKRQENRKKEAEKRKKK